MSGVESPPSSSSSSSSPVAAATAALEGAWRDLHEHPYVAAAAGAILLGVALYWWRRRNDLSRTHLHGDYDYIIGE